MKPLRTVTVKELFARIGQLTTERDLLIERVEQLESELVLAINKNGAEPAKQKAAEKA